VRRCVSRENCVVASGDDTTECGDIGAAELLREPYGTKTTLKRALPLSMCS
jgi:hypothetical protein